MAIQQAVLVAAVEPADLVAAVALAVTKDFAALRLCSAAQATPAGQVVHRAPAVSEATEAQRDLASIPRAWADLCAVMAPMVLKVIGAGSARMGNEAKMAKKAKMAWMVSMRRVPWQRRQPAATAVTETRATQAMQVW